MRDLRDPQALGRFLLDCNHKFGADTLSKTYDKFRNVNCPDYPQDESMAKVTAREYREELEIAAAAGDKYAVARLRDLG